MRHQKMSRVKRAVPQLQEKVSPSPRRKSRWPASCGGANGNSSPRCRGQQKGTVFVDCAPQQNGKTFHRLLSAGVSGRYVSLKCRECVMPQESATSQPLCTFLMSIIILLTIFV